MMKIAILCLLAGCAVASYQPYSYHPRVKVIKVKEPEPEPAPAEPYEFSFDIEDEDGNKQGRSESGDAHGNKKGAYSIQLADGRQRWVEYVADGDGVRMVIRTNEPGTEDQDPADVDLTVEEAELKPTKGPKEEKKYKIVKVPVHPGHGYY